MGSRNRVRRFAPLLAVAALALGCQGESADSGTQARVQDTGTEILGDPQAVVAVVDGEEITLAEVDLVAGFWASIRSPELQGVRNRKEAQQRALDNIIDQHVLSREARRRDIAASDSALAEMLQAWESRFAGPEERDQKLAASHITMADVRASFGRDLLVRELVDRTIRDTLHVSDEEVRAYFEQNPQVFDTTQVHAHQILVLGAADAPPESLALARARADQLLARVRGGEEFAALARAYSEDPSSAQRGGDLGFVRRGSLIPALEEAAFALRPGETSGLVQAPYGFHILRVTECRNGSLAFDAELAERIRGFLIQQRLQPEVDGLAGRLRAQARVELRI